jgi:hypothetical protein
MKESAEQALCTGRADGTLFRIGRHWPGASDAQRSAK